MMNRTDKGHLAFAAFYTALGVSAERGWMGRQRSQLFAGTSDSVLKIGAGTEAEQDARGKGYGALVEILRDQAAHLRSQLDQERQTRAEARRIIGGLVQRVPEPEVPSPSESPEYRESPATTRTRAQKTPPATLRRLRSVLGGGARGIRWG